MSCQRATSPINIEPTDAKCDLKCRYALGYPSYKWSVERSPSVLTFRPADNQSTPCAQYNDMDYTLEKMCVYSPSIHAWGGSKSPAELIIVHKARDSGQSLLVCLPVTDGLVASRDFDGLLAQAIERPVGKARSSLGNASLSLGKLIPRERFYAYSAVSPVADCGLSQVLVFPSSASLGISSQVRGGLTHGLSDSGFPMRPVPPGYAMSSEPPSTRGTQQGLGDNIYIDCTPTESVGETLVPLEVHGSSLGNWIESGIHSRIALIVAGAGVMVAGWYSIQKLVSSASRKS